MATTVGLEVTLGLEVTIGLAVTAALDIFGFASPMGSVSTLRPSCTGVTTSNKSLSIAGMLAVVGGFVPTDDSSELAGSAAKICFAPTVGVPVSLSSAPDDASLGGIGSAETTCLASMMGTLASFCGLVLGFVSTVSLAWVGLDLGEGLALMELTLRLLLDLARESALRLDFGLAATVAGAVGFVDLLLSWAEVTVEE